MQLLLIVEKLDMVSADVSRLHSMYCVMWMPSQSTVAAAAAAAAEHLVVLLLLLLLWQVELSFSAVAPC
jgi:hypothetical protein